MKFRNEAHRRAVFAAMGNKFSAGNKFVMPVSQHDFDIPVTAQELMSAGYGSAFLPSVTQLELRPSLGIGWSQKPGVESSGDFSDAIASAVLKLWPDRDVRPVGDVGSGVSGVLGDSMVSANISDAIVKLWPDKRQPVEEVYYVVAE